MNDFAWFLTPPLDASFYQKKGNQILPNHDYCHGFRYFIEIGQHKKKGEGLCKSPVWKKHFFIWRVPLLDLISILLLCNKKKNTSHWCRWIIIAGHFNYTHRVWLMNLHKAPSIIISSFWKNRVTWCKKGMI